MDRCGGKHPVGVVSFASSLSLSRSLALVRACRSIVLTGAYGWESTVLDQIELIHDATDWRRDDGRVGRLRGAAAGGPRRAGHRDEHDILERHSHR